MSRTAAKEDLIDIEQAQAIAATQAEAAALHAALVCYGLVVWTGGNVSGRVPGRTSS